MLVQFKLRISLWDFLTSEGESLHTEGTKGTRRAFLIQAPNSHINIPTQFQIIW